MSDPSAPDGSHRLPPERVPPMLAEAADSPPNGERWAYEIKWDGVRAITYVDETGVYAYSRNDKDLTPSFPELADIGQRFGDRAMILDGELVATGQDGRPTFNAMQQRLHLSDAVEVARRARLIPVTYIVFDLLHLDGRWLLDLSYDERREELLALEPFAAAGAAGASGDGGPSGGGGGSGGRGRKTAGTARLADSFKGVRGDDVLAAAREGGLEGILAKQRDSPYRPGRRSAEWLKIKIDRMQEVVVAGWTEGQGGRFGDLGALLLGVPDGAGNLVYAGRVGTGFSETARRELLALLAPHARETTPFSAPLTPHEMRGVHFADPVLVGEVRYGEWTPDGRLRHPTWRGLRPDKSPDEIRSER